MGIHPKDHHSDNPRMQCVVCGKWKRMIVDGEQLFYGGCGYTNGNHLAAKNDDDYVCQPCCDVACKAISEKPISPNESHSSE